MTDAILFYGGIAVLGLTLLAIMFYLIFHHANAKKLGAQLDAEYGEAQKQ